MNRTPRLRYRGDGTTREGKTVGTPGEKGRYLADQELVDAVNAVLAIGHPLLVTGDPGTGKTVLAHSIAAELELGEVEVFTVRSDHQGRDLLYEFDNLQRFHDAQVKDPRARHRKAYLRLGALGRAIQSGERRVVLIDEIDKAPRDFPNDLLHVLDQMEVLIPEIDARLRTDEDKRPVVVITSNQESELPEAFLRRCVFHNIEFPDEGRLKKILEERLDDDLGPELRDRIVQRFVEVRKVPGLHRQPATGELLAWARVLESAGVAASDLAGDLEETPFLGVLLKTREDLERVRPRHRGRETAA